MIKKFTILLMILVLSSCTGNSINQLKASQKNDFIIDVRSANEYQTGHLKNAINIPHTQIKEKISMYVKKLDSKIILYCRSGRRSGIAQQDLLKMGYKNAVNAGGYEALKSKGYK